MHTDPLSRAPGALSPDASSLPRVWHTVGLFGLAGVQPSCIKQKALTALHSFQWYLRDSSIWKSSLDLWLSNLRESTMDSVGFFFSVLLPSELNMLYFTYILFSPYTIKSYQLVPKLLLAVVWGYIYHWENKVILGETFHAKALLGTQSRSSDSGLVLDASGLAYHSTKIKPPW